MKRIAQIVLIISTFGNAPSFSQTHRPCTPFELTELNSMKKFDLNNEFCKAEGKMNSADSMVTAAMDAALKMAKSDNRYGVRKFEEEAELFKSDSASCDREKDRIFRVMQKKRLTPEC